MVIFSASAIQNVIGKISAYNLIADNINDHKYSHIPQPGIFYAYKTSL